MIKEGVPLDPSRQSRSEAGDDVVVLVVSPSRTRREELSRRLASKTHVLVVGATTGREAILQHGRDLDRIDVLITERSLPDMGGGELADRMRKSSPRITTIVVPGDAMADDVTDHVVEIWGALYRIHLRWSDLARIYALTPQEARAALLVAQGLTNVQIADRLHLAEATVRNYVSRVLQKTGLSNRTQLARAVLEQARHNRPDI